MTKPAGQAAIYLRMSMDRTGDRAGHDRQLADCRKLAKTLGLTVSKVYTDTESATDPKVVRTGFEDLLTSKPSAVITWHEDRLIRTTRDLERVIALGVDVHVVKHGRLELSTPTGRAVARTVVAWAQYETEHKAQRQKAANQQRAEAGQPWRAGRRAFGYTDDYSKTVPREAKLVKQAFSDVQDGVSLRSIVRRWNAAGWKSSQGNPWTTAALRLLLKNPTYCGQRRLNGVVVADLKDVRAIVDKDTFAAVQVIINDPARLTSDRGGRGPLHLLSGVATCGLCGGRLSAGMAQARSGFTYRVWRCMEGLHLSRKAEPIEEFVTSVVLARLKRPDAAELFKVAAPDMAPLRTRAAELRRQRETLAEDLTVDLSFAMKRDARLRSELEKVENEIAQTLVGNALTPFAHGRDPEAVWAELDTDARREVIRELIEVRVLPVGRHGRMDFDPESLVIKPRRV